MWTSPGGQQPQAADPSDFEADVVTGVVVLVPADESAEVDEEELLDSLDDDEWWPEPECESMLERLPEWLPVLRRESLRESVR